MTQKLIDAGKALYGERWQTDLGRALGLPDARRVRQWLSGDRPIPARVWDDVAKLLRERKAVIDATLERIEAPATSD